MKKIQYLLKNTLVFALGVFGTKIITFLLVPLYTHVLLPEEYGLVDLVFSVCTVLVPLLTFNVNEAILRFSLDKGADQNKIMSIGMLCIGIMTAAAICIYPLFKLYTPLAGYEAYALWYIVTSGCSTVFLYNLRGKELLLHFSIGNILNTITVATMNIVFLLAFDMGLQGYFLAYVIANIVTALYSFFAGRVFIAVKNFAIEKNLMVSMLSYSLVLIPNSFMWWIMDFSDRAVLTYFLGTSIVGTYAVSGKLPSMILMVSSIFNQAWNYSAIKENESKDRVAYNNTVFDCLTAVVISMAVAVLVVLKPFLAVYVEESYFEAWRYTPPLIVGTAVLVLATFLASTYTVQKDSKGYLFSASAGAAANIVLNLILIPLAGAFGAAVATCISYIVVFVYRYYDTRKYLLLRVFTLEHIVAFLCLCISAFAVYLDEFCYGIMALAVVILIITLRKKVIFLYQIAKKVLGDILHTFKRKIDC